ncbi:MAG: putative addiction module antidote protein [Methylotenera sp.]|uniref:addiction module antidote protein n=1 Tax=Methylotenera sp. TaxID=2051956 RepID=UPI002487ADFD|nr:addiction module antidote protein [Methylotenera sp.]MDI1298782.1 putative addiction module antidote protein [Methylotenera sp.]MDI1307918.1 putative addiction module antidote protein [Methylotenera sp.]
MTNKIKIADLPEFDMAEHIKTEADIAAYLNIVLEEGDASELAHALGIIARAKGMADIAQKSGITREALYKALRPNAHPRFDTVNKVMHAMGVKLHASV